MAPENSVYQNDALYVLEYCKFETRLILENELFEKWSN
jgi:hypothetical protein